MGSGGHMTTRAARVLFVGPDARAGGAIVETLRAGWAAPIVAVHVTQIGDAVPELTEHPVNCVLLELDGCAGPALDPLHELAAAAPDAPIVVVCHEIGDLEGLEAVRAGAQDVLLASELTPTALARSVGYAIERKRAEVALGRQALQDPLTGLPNRILLGDRLTVALDRARRTGRWPAVMFLDVDAFKAVNDTQGHAAGDTLLQGLADRFRDLLRPMDTVARVGGDEFIFLFEELGDRTEAAARPIALTRGRETTVTVSVGVAMVDHPDVDLDDALRAADAAMYQAKHAGGGRAELFEVPPSGAAAVPERAAEALQAAIENRQLRVHYQPRVSINGRTGLVGFEALVRWEHPELGLIEPAAFVPLAEETGLIGPLEEWVLEQALAQLARWHESRPGMTVSVNVAALRLDDPAYVARLRAALARTGSDPRVLCLEVEQAALTGPPARTTVLRALRELGVRLALDGVGRQGGSLPALAELPVDTLKIDRDPISQLGIEDDARVGAVVELGHALGLDVVADGVETDDQLARLRSLGCDGAQGFLFSRPVPEGAIGELLGTR